MKTLRKMEFVTVTLVAADNGHSLTLYDANGRKIGVVSKHSAHQPATSRLSEMLWIRKLKAMCVINLKAEEHAGKDGGEWQRKLDTWGKGIRLRQLDKTRPREGKRYFSDFSRPDWIAAIHCMKFAHRNRVRRKHRNSCNPWLRWAETCSKNHNRKERNRAAQRQEARPERGPSVNHATEATLGRPAIQMRIDWDGVDSTAFVA
jgi:hypothetical protein